MTPDAFEIRLPPRPEFLGTARTFIAQIARGLGADEETVSDVQLAVSEACADALDADEPIRVRAVASSGALEIEVGAPPRTIGVEGLAGVQRLELVRALFPDASLGASEGARVLRFAASLGRSSGV